MTEYLKFEGTVEELKQYNKDKNKIIRRYQWEFQDMQHSEKTESKSDMHRRKRISF